MKTIIYVGEFKFPLGDAGSKRVLNMAKSFRNIGYNVVILGNGTLRPEDYDTSTNKYYYDGFEYGNIRDKKVSKINRLYQYIVSGFLALKKIKSYIKENNVYAVVLVGGYTRYSAVLLPFLKSKGIYIVSEVMEWFDANSLPFGKFGISYWGCQLGLRFFYVKSKNIIAISKLLESYYRNKDCNVIRIPPTVDIPNNYSIIQTTNNKKLNIIYAGIPGKKDFLKTIIEGIYESNEYDKIDFNIYGPSYNTVRALMNESADLIERMSGSIHIHGHKTMGQVSEAIRNADFSILLRPNKRYANAGFPSKVVESQSLGIPVILNYTSDLDMYIFDGKNGLIVSEPTTIELAKVLKKAVSLTNEEINQMKINSLKVANEYFSFEVYKENLRIFLDILR